MLSTFTMPASIAAVPLPVITSTSLLVWCSHCSCSVVRLTIFWKSALRWPIGWRPIACRTVSGTGVGPGIIRVSLSCMG
ncbi:MAG: hypothetical protein ACKOBY_08395, partial [Cyanobium sp.]